MAVGHQILTIVYFIIKHQITYDDLGEDFYDPQPVDHLKHHHLKRLQRLGFNVKVIELRRTRSTLFRTRQCQHLPYRTHYCIISWILGTATLFP